VRQRAYGDKVYASERIVPHRLQIHIARGLDRNLRQHSANLLDRLLHLRRRHVVEQNRLCATHNGLLQLRLAPHLDLYHLPWVHAQLGGPEQVYHTEPTHLTNDLFGYIMPSFDAARAETGPTMPLFSSLPKTFEYALDIILLFPNTGILLAPSWAQVIILHGDTPSTTRQTLNGYVVGDELLKPENEEALAGFVGYLHEVNIQDMAILAGLQDGRRGGNATDAGRFAPCWDDLGLRLAKRVAQAY